MKSVMLIDYDMGNITSVANAFEVAGCDVKISRDPAGIANAERLVLPGVGAFGEGMEHLTKLNLIDAMRTHALKNQRPFMGICLGMQLLADRGYEFGDHAGLTWIPGEVKRLEVKDLRLPHVGWNNLKVVKKKSPFLQGLSDEVDFYFVHSFHFIPKNVDVIAATCDYGGDFCAVIEKENIFGAQFHPEKSQKAGSLLLKNFLNL
ncbi:MAG: Imidazole glycerol phosphate synthase subunit HisH [Parcubacteria group bacterium GW2011_GWF2_45_11]|nr:MAG: Imidazole glycerol phosphate synthase subunit HisH [Parcubacteria group bacterium GW2011_GWF2_45_11]OGW69907.1 MAG: imidazole glycerol phosphate synthase, glutamine amidotransferase subunit [Omnitrophica bacterium GWA2_50_21]